MTVVANLLAQGIPVLIGDTLITTREEGAQSVSVPTVQALPPLERPISGFCRKVYIINKRLAVAWAGSTSGAGQIIPSLRQNTSQHGVTESGMKELLRGFTFSPALSNELRLVGWIAEAECAPRPFWWSSLTPDEIYFDVYDIEGTGEQIFRTVFFSKDAASSGGGLTQHEHASLTSLAGIARLLTIEVNRGIPLQHGFGFCYDVAYWHNYRFKYVPSYTQVNVACTYDSRTGKGSIKFDGPILIYNSLGRAAAFSVVRWSTEMNADLSRSLSGVEPILIPPVCDVPIDRPLAKLKFHSKYFCAFFSVVDEQNRSFVAPFCITDEAQPGDGMWMSKEGSKEVIQFNTNIIASMHKALFETNGCLR